jgi:hypothetical protein
MIGTAEGAAPRSPARERANLAKVVSDKRTLWHRLVVEVGHVRGAQRLQMAEVWFHGLGSRVEDLILITTERRAVRPRPQTSRVWRTGSRSERHSPYRCGPARRWPSRRPAPARPSPGTPVRVGGRWSAHALHSPSAGLTWSSAASACGSAALHVSRCASFSTTSQLSCCRDCVCAPRSARGLSSSATD